MKVMQMHDIIMWYVHCLSCSLFV